jgi:hypothetical protein
MRRALPGGGLIRPGGPQDGPEHPTTGQYL